MNFDINDLMSDDKKKIRDTNEPARKQGRPTKDNKRKNIAATYLSDDEKKLLDAKIHEEDRSVATYLRQLILKDLRE